MNKPYLIWCKDCNDEIAICSTLSEVEAELDKQARTLKDVEIDDEPGDSKIVVSTYCEMCDWANS